MLLGQNLGLQMLPRVFPVEYLEQQGSKYHIIWLRIRNLIAVDIRNQIL